MQVRLGMTAAIMVLAMAGLMVASSVTPPVQAMEASSNERRQAAEQLVLEFWKRVWNPPHDLAAVQDLVVEDFVLTSAGTDIQGRDAFAKWIAAFQTKARDLRLEAYETFANAEATRVTSRWHATASNGGMLGTEPDGRPISFTGIAIWEIRWTPEGPRLARNWVERSAWELYQQLKAAPPPSTRAQ